MAWAILLQLGVEPRPRVSPVPISGSGRYAQGIRGLGNRQAGKIAKRDEAGFERIRLLKAFEGFVDCQNIQGGLRGGDPDVFDVLSPASTASSLALFVPCLVDEDTPHGRGGRGEEVMAIAINAGLGSAHQPQIGLVDQGGGFERLAGLFLGQLLRRQLAQLVVDQRQELFSGVGIAVLNGGQDARDFGHRPQAYRL